MANVDRPNGLRPVGTKGAGNWNGAVSMYLLPSTDNTATFKGDLVKLGGSAGAAGTVVNGIDVEGMPTIAQSAAGDVHISVLVGLLPLQTDLSVKHRTASTNRIALVSDDPMTVYEIQEVSGGTALTATEVGLNANVVVGTGNTTTGASGVELDNATEAATAALDVHILGLVRRPDNAFGEHAKWLVMISDHSFNIAQVGL